MKKLRELTVEELFESFVLIKNADVRVAKNGKKFIAFTFQDTSGTIDGNIGTPLRMKLHGLLRETLFY